MSLRPRLRAAALAAAGALLLAGCASPPPPPKPTLVDAAISLADDVNPDPSKRPSPLVLRVYELSARGAFDAADLVSLLQQDKATLGAELVAGQEWTMTPGERRRWAAPLAATTRFIGVTAAYRDIAHARWRAVVPVQPNATNRLAIRAEALAVTAEPR